MEYLESQLRQKFASVVWTHKIQEKQADYYKRLNNFEEKYIRDNSRLAFYFES